MPPEGGLSHTLVRTVGRARALEIMWHGNVPTQQLQQWGLVQRSLQRAKAQTQALRWAEELGQLPPSVMASIKGWPTTPPFRHCVRR